MTTLRDIARRTGLSKQSVSKVLHGGSTTARVSRTTQELVLRVAQELGYRCNGAARAVATGRFGAVGLIVSLDPWRSDLPAAVLSGINRRLYDAGLHLRVFVLPEELATDQHDLPAFVRESHVDGFLVKYDTAIPPAMAEVLHAAGAPLVWVNSRHRDRCIFPDEFQAGVIATRHLIDLGHRHIAFADLSPRSGDHHYASEDRRAGHISAMVANGLRLQVIADRSVPGSERLALLRQLLQAPGRPTALIVSDALSEGLAVMHVAALLGLSIPGDLSLVAIHDSVMDHLGVPMTTVCRPWEALGTGAVDMVLRSILRPSEVQEPMGIPFTVHIGATTAPPP